MHVSNWFSVSLPLFLHPFVRSPMEALLATIPVELSLVPILVCHDLNDKIQKIQATLKTINSHPQIIPVEYFNINGINALNCACVIFSTGVGIPSIINGGNSNSDGSSCTFGGACWANAASSSSITIVRKFLITSSSGFAPNTLYILFGLPGVATNTTACCPTRVAYSNIVCYRSYGKRELKDKNFAIFFFGSEGMMKSIEDRGIDTTKCQCKLYLQICKFIKF